MGVGRDLQRGGGALVSSTRPLFETSQAPASPYRYTLERAWSCGPKVLWIMLNPSTADEFKDDATIRRCIGFTKRWGYCGLGVVNLFALRSTDPRGLLVAKDPIGPQNDQALRLAFLNPGYALMVAAWGRSVSALPAALRGRAGAVLAMAGQEGHVLHCLGRTADGDPRHPVRLPYDTELEVLA